MDIVRHRAGLHPDRYVYTFLPDGEVEEIHLSYAELDRRSRAVAALLQKNGLAGEPVFIACSSELEFIVAFYGCLYAGAIAVPGYAPRLNRPSPRIRALTEDSGARAALTDQAILSNASRFTHEPALQKLQWLATDDLLAGLEDEWRAPDLTGDSLAMLQYTSGSTSSPKGVMLTHRNLLHNAREMQAVFNHTEVSIGVCWLPLFHDLGLIGNVLQTIYVGGYTILMPPTAFLQKPLRWLEAMSRYQATSSSAPSFAYDLAVEKTTPEQRAKLDLSHWQVAGCGAEPIRLASLESFADTFEPSGFRREAFCPAYGLAESTLMVTGVSTLEPLTTRRVDRASLQQHRVAHPLADSSDQGITLVSCGSPLDVNLAIVDPETSNRLPASQVGEIWVASNSVAQGYWQRPEATQQTFQAHLADSGEGPFLRTGDLGFVEDGQLFVTGRLKDLIIIRGQNYYPEDIEYSVETCHPALQVAGSAAFAIEADDREQLVVVAEVQRTHLRDDLDAVINAIRAAIFDTYEIQAQSVVLAKPLNIPRTSSGKIQRFACRDAYLDGSLKMLKQDTLGSGQEDGKPSASLPRTPVEEAVLEAWRDILGVERVNSDDNFFEMGGQSLFATQLLARIQAIFDAELSLEGIFEDPTPAGLAARIEAALGSSQPAEAIPPMTPVSRANELPLSFSQERMWFVQQFAPGSAAYNIPIGVWLRGPLDLKIFERAFNDVLRRHEVLRTTFGDQNGIPHQAIAPFTPYSIPVEYLGTLPTESRQAEALRRAERVASAPFDLGEESLFRFRLFQIETDLHLGVLVLHHIISDAWSVGVLWQELTAGYEAFTEGRQPDLPDLPIQMVDFAAWQREWLRGETLESQLQYWKQQLSDVPTILELPTDNPRPAVQSYFGADYPLHDVSDLLARVKKLSEKLDVTPFMVFQAAFSALLYYYTGQDDLLVGVPIANRRWLPTEPLIGMFVNTLALHTNLSGDPTFRELAGRVRRTALEAYAHQDFPFERLIEEVNIERDPGYTPLVQVMCTVSNIPFNSGQMKDVEWEAVLVDRGSAQYDLTLTVIDTRNVQQITINYNTDLFFPETIARLAQHYIQLLNEVAADPDQPLSNLSILTPQEEQHLLVDWNQTEKDYLSGVCLHQLFEAQAARTPNAVAVVFEDSHLTYTDLNRKADRFAHLLQELGVGPDAPVGVFVERSLNMVVGLLGILKAGGAYVPLDPEFPTERIEMILEDAEIGLLLSDTSLKDRMPRTNALVLYLDEEINGPVVPRDEPLISRAEPHNLSYIIFTSGSTGRPKGVGIEHGAVVSFLESMRRTPGLSADDRLLAVTTLSFDISVLEIFLPLSTGALVVIGSREVARNGSALIALMEKVDATIFQATPATWQLLLESGWQGKANLKALCGGEALSMELAKQLVPRVNSLWNMYGPTETTVWSTVQQVTEANITHGIIPIGHPIDNWKTYIVDKWQRPVPVGVPGELWIGGKGVARGYINRPDLTAEKFIPDPFSDDPEDRVYRTGDLAAYLPDGAIQFKGRVDFQVKIRGFRIELGDIESNLVQHPGIQQCVVIVREDKPGDKRLVAYLIPADGVAPANEALRIFLQEKLPQYMIPSAFVTMEAFPLTASGKINRRALPEPQIDMLAVDAQRDGPRNLIERKLTSIWEAVLEIKRVGIHDDFFAIGGHSLSAARLMARIEKVFGLKLPLVTLFQAPTIAELAAIIQDREWAPSWSSLVEIVPGGARQPFFCVHAHGGNVIGYADLARHLGDDQPFYGLQARGLNGDIAEDSRLEDMAAHYIQEIRAVQRHGPYLLGGWCMGGIIAYEMARQLQDQGEQVEMLAMIQSAHPDYPRFRPGTTFIHKLFSQLISRIDREISLLSERGETSTQAHFGQRIGRMSLIASGLGQKWVGALLGKLGIPFEYSQTYKLYALEEVHEAALAAYTPGPYDGRVAVFRAGSQPLGIFPDETLGWGGLLNKDRISLHEIPGNQVGIISEPQVKLLARDLETILAMTDTGIDPSEHSAKFRHEHFSLTGAGTTDALPGR